MVFTSVCSYVGWWLGDMISLFWAVILSALGAGIGLYIGRRLQHDYLS
jgi:hypothetical protein